MKKILIGLGLLLVCAWGFGYWYLQSSQVRPGGSHVIPSLDKSVEVAEDAHGVPVISAESLPDAVRAQGWIVARDRFFQMDLIRRRSEGNLSEIFGEAALESDRRHRIYGFLQLAQKMVHNLVPESRELLEAFAEGVNGFLSENVLPVEIRILGYKPEPWHAYDVALVALSMFDPPASEREMELITKVIPDNALRFFLPDFGFLDAPIIPDGKAPTLPAVPDSNKINLRVASLFKGLPFGGRDAANVYNGSNAWVIAGSRTTSGKPILAGDPHLALALPNVWYRLQIRIPDVEVTGVTIPGIPGVLIGSNSKVAWTFTNGMADSADWVVLNPGTTPEEYLIEGVSTAFTTRTEIIPVKGKPPVQELVRETIWGPVVKEEPSGIKLALQWVALDASNFKRLEMSRLNRANDLESALDAVSEWSGPVHNALFATKDGHIGWTVVGKIPKRVGFDGSVSVVRDRNRYWDGYIPFSQYPKVKDPSSGVIVSANQRYLPFDQNPRRFSTNWAPPVRAFRIQEELLKKKDWGVDAAYQLQLDVVSPVHQYYQTQILQMGWEKDNDPWLKEIQKVVAGWDGKASVDSAGYVFVKKYRAALFDLFLNPLMTSVPKDEKSDVRDRLMRDEWLITLLKDKPMHMLVAEYATYDAAVKDVALKTAKELVSRPEKLAKLKWGDFNQTEITHPFSRVLPKFLGGLVNLPKKPLPGSDLIIREGNPSHAASMRMVVDLNDASKSIFNQPGGQSGHFLSANYKDQFSDWIEGKPDLFLPGKAVVTTHFTK